MSSISLLDCTLRDGGYINDWNFGYHATKDIIRKLVESQVDYVEVGFLRNCEIDENRSLYNHCSDMERVLPPAEKRGNTKFTAMILHNKYDINQLEPYDGKTIDAIRVTFHDYDIDEGLEYIQKVQSKGYKVFCNPINIMGYSDSMILDLIQKVNNIQPYAFSIVDTFGSMMKADLHRIYSLIEHNLDKSVVIGLHLHENMALSYALAQEFIAIKAPERQVVIDGSMLGMGRVPGNLCIELIMEYMNRNHGRNYDVNPVLDGIDDYIVQLKEIEPWGYNIAYSISAKYNLHRNYAEYLLGKGRLRAKQINQILGSIEEKKKTAYDEAYIEELYENYQNNKVDDSSLLGALKDKWEDRPILVLAPGASITESRKVVEDYINDSRPIVVSANFMPDTYMVDYVFCSNAMRYSAMEEKVEAEKLLVTSNLLDVCEQDNMLNYMELCFDEKGKCDNCVIMIFRLLLRLGITKVAVAGFDGYQAGKCNYAASYLTSQHTKGVEENAIITERVVDIKKKMDIRFLTPSLYNR